MCSFNATNVNDTLERYTWTIYEEARQQKNLKILGHTPSIVYSPIFFNILASRVAVG